MLPENLPECMAKRMRIRVISEFSPASYDTEMVFQAVLVQAICEQKFKMMVSSLKSLITEFMVRRKPLIHGTCIALLLTTCSREKIFLHVCKCFQCALVAVSAHEYIFGLFRLPAFKQSNRPSMLSINCCLHSIFRQCTKRYMRVNSCCNRMAENLRCQTHPHGSKWG